MMELSIEEDGSAEISLDLQSLGFIIDSCSNICIDGKKDLNIDNISTSSVKFIKILLGENLSKYTFSLYLKEKVLYIELDKNGLHVFLTLLNALKKEVIEKGHSHCHFMTEEWGGNELTIQTCLDVNPINMLTVYVS